MKTEKQFKQMKVSEICSFKNWIELESLYQESVKKFPYPTPLKDLVSGKNKAVILRKMINKHKSLTGAKKWPHPYHLASFDDYMKAFKYRFNVQQQDY